MPYSTTTLSAAKTALAARLSDPSKVFYTDTELGNYIKEALRTWGACAMYWRDRGTFNTTSGTAFYDLAELLTSGDGTLIVNRTITNREIVNDLERHLIEPVTSDWVTGWGGSEQFTMFDLEQAIGRRRDRFVAETGQIANASKLTAANLDAGRIPIDATIIDVRRAAWITLDGEGAEDRYQNLWREDEEGLNAWNPGWSQTASEPSSFSLVLTPQASLQLAPVPVDTGNLHLITANSTGASPTTTETTIDLANDFTPYLKWGALGDLLSKDGQARDIGRARYCEGRYKEGVELAKLAACVMQAQVNGVPVPVTSLMDLDVNVPNWQNTAGEPEAVSVAAHNLIALYKVPGATSGVPEGNHAITLDVVRNAPIPADDAAYLQIGGEHLEAILGYAEHLALFKCGGAEFEASLPLYENFMQAAARYNQTLKSHSENFEVLKDKTKREHRQRVDA